MIDQKKIAIWAITPNGVGLASELNRRIPGSELFLSAGSLADHDKAGT